MVDKGFQKYWEYVKRFWDYIWNDDSFLSYVLNFALAFLFIKFLFFPALGFVLNNDYPIVAIVSGSMEHKVVNGAVCHVYISNVKSKNLNFDEWWKYCGEYYEDNFDIAREDFFEFEYRNGLNIGDVMVLYGEDPQDIEIGEVLVFVPENRAWFESHGPVIHRVVDKWEEDGTIYFQTKGDHNRDSTDNFETRISEDDVIGTPILRIPFIGYFKIWLFDLARGVGGVFMRGG